VCRWDRLGVETDLLSGNVCRWDRLGVETDLLRGMCVGGTG